MLQTRIQILFYSPKKFNIIPLHSQVILKFDSTVQYH